METARAKAVSEKRQIEVVGLRDSTSSTFVNADGTFTTQISLGTRNVKQSDGSWVPLDTDLKVGSDGRLRAGAAPFDVSLSNGGSGAAIDVVPALGKRARWDLGTLPVPVVKRDTARYVDVSPGVDLLAQVTAHGFELSYVLTRRPASTPSLRFPLLLNGLALSADSGGDPVLKAGATSLVRSAPAYMWDANADLAAHPEEAVEVPQSVGTTSITLSPDSAFLQAASTQYPVTIDPFYGLSLTASTYINQASPTTNYDTLNYLRTGPEDASGASAQRTLLRFPLPSVVTGTHILSANLQLYLSAAVAPVCSDATVVRPLTSSFASNTVTWSSRPSVTSTAYDSTTFSAPCSNAWQSFDVQDVVQMWANSTLTNNGLALLAANEGATGSQKIWRSENFAGYTPSLGVTYNSYPATTLGRSMSPLVVDSANKWWTNSSNPLLLGGADDADGGTNRLHVEVTNTAHTTTYFTGDGQYVPINTQSGVAVDGSPALVDGATYSWRAKQYDGTDYSQNWTTWLDFTVDTSAPTAPTVSSSAYPANAWNNAGGSGTFTFNSSDVGGIDHYSYVLDGAASVNLASGATSVTLTPSDGWHVLSVTATDKAGNVSGSTAYQFGGAPVITSPAEGDASGSTFTLSAMAGTGSGVTYNYRKVSTDPWTAVPVGDISLNGTALTAWPLTTTATTVDGTSVPAVTHPELLWDALSTRVLPGAIQLQACFGSTCSGARNLTVYTPPTQPLSAAASAGAHQATVTWTAPLSSGTSPITSYTVTSNPGNVTKTTANGTTTSALVAGLVNGVSYTFTVVANTAYGASPPSMPTSAVTPSEIPAAPAQPSAVPSHNSAIVTWQAPDDGGVPIDSYTVTASPGGATATSTSATTATVTGLTDGTAYTFTVTATNIKGTGPASPATSAVTPASVPGAPTALSATAGNGLVTLGWTAPTYVGSPSLDSYTITTYPSGAKTSVASASGTSVALKGLTNGQGYSFLVVAHNSQGDGPPSVMSATVTPSGALTAGGIATGQVTTFVGNGTAATSAGTGTGAGLNQPAGVVATGGYLYTLTYDSITKTNAGTGATTILTGTPGTPACASGAYNTAKIKLQTVYNGTSNVPQTLNNDLETDGTSLFVLDFCGIQKVNLSTRDTTLLYDYNLATPPPPLRAITLAGDGSLYGVAVAGLATSVYKIDPNTGSTSPFASAAMSTEFTDITSDSSALYVTQYDDAGTSLGSDRRNGRITRIDLTSHTQSPLLSDVNITEGQLTSVGDYIYYSSKTLINPSDQTAGTATGPRLRRVSKTTSDSAAQVAGSATGSVDDIGTRARFGTIQDLSSDGTSLWVADTANNLVRRVTDAPALPAEQPLWPDHTAEITQGALYVAAGNPGLTAQTTNAGTRNTTTLNTPRGTVVVGGNVYTATADSLVQTDLATQVSSILAGSPGNPGAADGATGATTRLSGGQDLATDDYWIYGLWGGRIVRTDPATGASSTVAAVPVTNVFAHLAVLPGGGLLATRANSLEVDYVDPISGVITNLNLAGIGGGWTEITSVATDSTRLYVAYRDASSNAALARYSLTDFHLIASTGVIAAAANSQANQTVITAAGPVVYFTALDDVNNSGAYDIRLIDKNFPNGSTTKLTVLSSAFHNPTHLTSDGSRLYAVDKDNHVVVDVVPVANDPNGNPGLLANPGGGNPALPACSGCAGDPVDLDTGAYYNSATDLAISGRGPGLVYSRSYSTLLASKSGRLGNGWSDDFTSALTINGSGVIITQENGSQVAFTCTTTCTAKPNVLASLALVNSTYVYTRQDRTALTFNSSGVLTQITDRNGVSTTLTYAGGRLTTVTDAAGRTLTFTYDAIGRVSKVADSGGRTVKYAYDGSNNLTRVTDVNGANTRYSYDTGHFITGQTDPRGHSTQVLYDTTAGVPFRRVVDEYDRRNKHTHFAYSNAADTTHNTGYTSVSVTDPRGNITRYVLLDHQMVSRTLAAGTTVQATWSYTYDPANGQVIRTVDPDGRITQAYYDSRGNATALVDPLLRITRTSYDTLGDAISTTDPMGVTTTRSFDKYGNILSESTPLVCSGQSATTRFRYDATNHGDLTGVTDPLGHTSTLTYDTYGNVVAESDATGRTRTATRGILGWETSSTAPAGNVAGANPALYRTTYGSLTGYGQPQLIKDPLGHTTHYTYDANGNLTDTTDSDQHHTHTDYDNDDNPTTTTAADTTTSTYAYDDNGNISSWTDERSKQTVYGYDAQDRPSSVTDPLTRQTITTYSPGSLVKTVDQPGVGATHLITTLTYDIAGQLLRRSYSDSTTPSVTYTYDGDGRVLTMADGTGTTRYTYDSLGRATDVTNGNNAHTGYGYDLADNLKTLTYPATGTYPSGPQVTYTYDNANRMRSVQDWNTHQTVYSYDQDGNLQTQTSPNTTTTTTGYDRADRLASITLKKGSTTLANFGYTLSNGDQIKTLTTSGTPQANENYDYTNLNQIHTITGSSNAGTTQFDTARRVTDLPDGSHFTYDDANQLGTRVKSGTTTTYSFDPRGNRTGATTGSTNLTYGYDQAGNLTSAPTQGAGSVTYTYDGTGLRQSRTASGVLTQYTWSDSSLPLLLDDGTYNYVYGADTSPVEAIRKSDQATSYLQPDQIGSTRVLTDASGNVTFAGYYNTHGGLAGSTGSNPTTFGFAGEVTDPTTGLVYLRARDYDSNTASLLSRDPIESATHDAYGYAAGNPLSNTDPSGAVCVGSLCSPSLQQAGDFAAGFADFWTFGLTRTARESMGADVVDYCDSAYTYGGVAGFVTSLPFLVRDAASLVRGGWKLFNAYREVGEFGSIYGRNTLGAAKRLKFENADYHGAVRSGGKNPAPTNGQQTLENSFQYKATSSRRIGVDSEAQEIVVFDETQEGVFHGHVRGWGELENEQKAALVKAGLATVRGKLK